MLTSCKNILDFLKIDFVLTFKNSLLLSIAHLLLIPVIRGISNLDNIHSAGVLGQSVALIGAIILIPITKQELETGIKEIIYTRAWSYMKSVGFRFLCGFLLIAVVITAFAMIMLCNNCIFPFWGYITVTILYAVFLGLLGLVFSQAGSNVIIGYLSALAYWSFCQLEIINEGSIAYMFPIVNGTLAIQKLVTLFLTVIILLGVLLALIKYSIRRI